jgi:hypothetical protein
MLEYLLLTIAALLSASCWPFSQKRGALRINAISKIFPFFFLIPSILGENELMEKKETIENEETEKFFNRKNSAILMTAATGGMMIYRYREVIVPFLSNNLWLLPLGLLLLIINLEQIVDFIKSEKILLKAS